MTSMPTNLTETFAATDTLVWGDFKIEKSTAQPVKEATFSVKGEVIELTLNEKRFMSLLIAYQGHAVPSQVFEEEFKIQTKFDPADGKNRRKDPLMNNMAVYASKVRHKVRKALGDEYANMISPANPNRRLREAGQWNKAIKTSYRLLPQPSVPSPYFT